MVCDFGQFLSIYLHCTTSIIIMPFYGCFVIFFIIKKGMSPISLLNPISYLCLCFTTRPDIIKVFKFLQMKDFKNIIGYRL